MAESKLGKTVRIDDKRYNPKGAKFEVWTKGRHKYIVHHMDSKGIQPSASTEYYIDGDKISASLTDDEVIKAWLSHREAVAKFMSDIQVYKVIQDPYSDDEPVTKRVYGDGKSPYYLNNGCSINIEWRGQKPNPAFNLGTFSNPEDAEDYYRKKTNGVRNGPDRFLRTTNENPVILTSSVDDATDESKLPTSSWVVEKPFIVGIDIDSQPEMSQPNYRDKSTVNDKVVTVNLPKGFTENGGKGYLVWTDGGLQYDSKAIPEDTSFEMMYIDRRGYGMGGRPRDQIVYFGSRNRDSDIVSEVIQKFISMVNAIQGVPYSSYDLKLCSPDSEECKLIEYKSPLEAPNNTPQQAAINDTPPGPSQSNTKIKLNIQGLFDSGDGTTPGSTSSVFEIKAKTDMPTFTVWTGEIPQTEEIDVFDDLQELDYEYTEGEFAGSEEVLVNGVPVASFMSVELSRDEDVSVDNGTGGGVDRGGSNVSTPGGDVSTSSVSLPTDLSKVQNSSVITKQSTGNGYRSITSDIIAPSGNRISGSSITKNMNEFVSDVLGPFATFLKSNYPSLYKSWYITSATRGYIPSGGSSTSQHLKGQAIDSQILGANSASPGENIKLLNAILTWYKSNPVGYGQILFETRGHSCWIHWSYSRGNTRLQLLRFKSDSTLRSASVNTTGSYVEPTVTSSSLGF